MHPHIAEATPMGGLSLWHWLALGAVVVLVLGSARIPGVMGELAKGIKAFRSNLKDDHLPHGDGTDGSKGPSSEA
jgi:sec-independent protein translocase protein TatA